MILGTTFAPMKLIHSRNGDNSMLKHNIVGFLVLSSSLLATASGTTSRSAPIAPPQVPPGAASAGSFSSGSNRAPAASAVSKPAPKKVSKPIPPPAPRFTPDQRAINDSLAFYLQAKSENSKFSLKDPLTEGQKWSLKATPSSPKYKKMGTGKQVVSRQFEGQLGADTTTHAVGLNFFMAKVGSRWKVKKVAIASVNGNPR